MKIRTQIIVLGLVLSILPLALVSFVIISVYTKELDGIAVDDLKSITSAQIDIIDNFFLECDTNMSILSDNDALYNLLGDSNEEKPVDTGDMENVQKDFRRQKEKQGFLISISAVDLNLKVAVSTEEVEYAQADSLKNVTGVDEMGDEAWFSNILEPGDFNVGQRCMVAVKKVYNDKNKCMGYLVQEISLEFFENLRISTSMIKGGTIYVADGKGALITAGVGEEQRQQYVLGSNQRGGFSKAWKDRDRSQPIGVIRYDIDGKTYLSSYGGFQNACWQILSSVCLDDITHTRENYMRVLVTALIVTALVVFIINLIMYRMFTSPIEKMVQTFETIRMEKDYKKRINDIPQNELRMIGNGINGLLKDIDLTLQRQREKLKTLKEQAERDSMSQLFNRTTIQEVLSMKIDNAFVDKSTLACVMVDIDDFKAYNTRYGHTGGDEVIRFIAEYMREISNDNAGRFGGDEFLMCLDQLNSEQEVVDMIENFMCRLRQGVYIKEEDRLIPISCSIGVAVISGLKETTYDKIVELADQAMYKVKNSTKNGYHICK